MSRSYTMHITVKDYDSEHREKIIDELMWEWEFENLPMEPEEIFLNGDGQLVGGETEKKFADRMAKIVFKANEGPCEVTVNAFCLEDMPYETHVRDDDDYERLMEKK